LFLSAGKCNGFKVGGAAKAETKGTPLKKDKTLNAIEGKNILFMTLLWPGYRKNSRNSPREKS
jgi:hypothetical protein